MRLTPEKLSIPGTQAQALEQARARLAWVVLALMVGYLAVALRLADLTLSRHDTSGEVARDIAPLEKPLRGAILDRNGELLAASLRMASVSADTTMVDDAGALATQLAALLPGQTRETLLRKLTSGKKFIWIQRDVTPRQEYAINALGSPALQFQEEGRRIYPGGPLAAHVLGYTDVDGNGIAGIEKAFDKTLGEKGEDVRLTLDLRAQHILRDALLETVKKFHAKAGTGVVMDARNGEILALVSLPDFDPADPGAATNDEKFNRATLGVFEMGSTFKLFSVAAALDSGKVSFGSIFDAGNPIKIGRFTINDYHAKRRPMSVPEIFIYSSNIGTARMADSLGAGAIESFFRKMGFMAQAPVELPERGTPLTPNPWRETSTLTASFGHGIAVSPLHVARATAALVNGGTMPTPTLLLRDTPPAEGERVVSEKTSEKLRKLLELVVAAGTGDHAYVEGYGVGGKTGTAEKNSGGHYNHNLLLSSFLGVFPMQDPRYVVLAILDEPKGIPESYGYATGGWTGAPVVARVVEQLGPLYRIPPDFTRGRKDAAREMSVYLKDYKEGTSLASVGTDH